MRNIFVFGCDTSGDLLRCSAKHAHSHYNAEWGVSEGLTGNAYAIPTTEDRYTKSRHILKIAESVQQFIKFAKKHPEMSFKVARIGCGLAGFTSEQIAPLFRKSPRNCTFDPEWSRFGLAVWRDVI